MEIVISNILGDLEQIVDGQFKDLRAALIGSGEFRLAETHSHFKLSKTDWVSKDARQRNRAYFRFQNYIPKNKKLVTSTNGQCTVVAPKTLGKKPKQNVRRPKTVSAPQKTKHSDSGSDKEN